MFENELRCSVTVIGITFDEGSYELSAIGIDPYFFVRFTFSEIEIEWDDYRSKAWYELHKQYKKQITLATDNGTTMHDVIISCNDEDVYSIDGDKPETPSVSVGIKYGEKEIWGYGKDFLLVDAFTALQKKLPDNVKIQCCLTCRHGNMCPVGNKELEIFCTKDVIITQRSDLYFYTEDGHEREKRSHDYTDICEDYQEQTNEYYTYNDYLFYLK